MVFNLKFIFILTLFYVLVVINNYNELFKSLKKNNIIIKVNFDNYSLIHVKDSNDELKIYKIYKNK